jgi:hypothetical protein
MSYNVHYRDGKLVTTPYSGIYLIQNGTKRAFPDALTFVSNSYSWGTAYMISANELSQIPDATPMSYNVHYRDGKLVTTPLDKGVYLVEDGKKRAFPNTQVFINNGFKWDQITLISDRELSLISQGTLML